MTDAAGASIHASAVRIGNRGVLIRGPSGSGKSRLAFDLITSGRSGQIAPAILVGDDRVHLDTGAGQLRVRAAPELAGLIEIRGLGIRHCEFTEEAIVGLVVDLKSRVVDLEALFEELLELSADAVAVVARVDEDVGRERGELGADRPDVEIVKVFDVRV